MIVDAKVSELLETLKKNREAHNAIFLEAVEGYQKEAVRILEEHIARIKKGTREQVYVSLPVPVEHTFDYDRAILMLKMHQGETFELDEQSFAELVMDEWGWRQTFLTSNSTYSPKAASLSRSQSTIQNRMAR